MASLGTLSERIGLGASAIVVTVIAMLAVPVRARLQRGVNRLLYGRRGEPYAVVSEHGRRLSSALAPGTALPVIVNTVANALKIPYVAIQLLQNDEFRAASAHGVADAHPFTIPLTHHGELLGRMAMSPRSPGEEFSPAELRLLHDLARQAGLALHGVRVTADLQRSRERLVAAREEERRRLRRDLHDGLGPTLAGVAYLLDGARLSAPADAKTGPILDALSTEIRGAIAEVRRLLDGLASATLDELGLLRTTKARAESLSTTSGSRSAIWRSCRTVLSR
ncbi:histidine kinase [Streptomyces sp. NPDC053560]|uniref:sensor histidine kinase n=1 Tax=Streptomyces sp. NPDC053560 TaxID=3365711 RepID=UPI0037CF9E09